MRNRIRCNILYTLEYFHILERLTLFNSAISKCMQYVCIDLYTFVYVCIYSTHNVKARLWSYPRRLP